MLLQAARGSLRTGDRAGKAFLERRHRIDKEVGRGARAHAQHRARRHYLFDIVGRGLRHQRLEFILCHDNSPSALGETA